jgi:hypothetical protein
VRKVPALIFLVVAGMLSALTTATPATAATVGDSHPQTGQIVSEDPANFTPHILDGTVYSVVQIGNMVVVGGSFTQVRQTTTSPIITRNRVMAFNATTGAISSSFNPNPNNTVFKVQAAGDGTSVYVGGRFSSAYGASMPSRLFKADVASGARDATFRPGTISGDIRDLEVMGNRLWVAGKFTHIGGAARRALGTINATTGTYDSYFSGVLAGTHRNITSYPSDRTNVLQISSNPDNTQITVVGNFTSVDGVARSQIAKFDTSGPSYALADWSTNLFTSSCSRNFETYMSDVEYSPDGKYFVVSTAGAYGGTTGSNAGTSGCDVVARFEASASTSATPATWTAYTGGDSTWTVEVTDNVVYVGGHQRWQNNPGAGDTIHDGAVSREGIAALNPVNGMAYSWNPTRTRGVGVQDMLATSQGLWVGSDTDRIGKNYEYHSNIALMPLEGGKTLPTMSNPTLPSTMYSVSSGGSQLTRRDFNGTTATTPTNAPNGSVSWGSTVGAFMSNGTLYTAASNGTVAKRTFNGSTYGSSSVVNTADLLESQATWHGTDVPSMTSLFFYNGEVFFTRSGQTTMYRRGFEPESDIVGQQRFNIPAVGGINYSTIRGAFVADNKFYYSNTSGQLFRADWSGRSPVGGTSVQISGPGMDSQNWASRTLFAYGGVATPPPPANESPTAAATISCEELVCSFDASDSDDPDGTIASYAWNFGDGTPNGSGETTTHTYGTAGERTMTLTVTDNDGATATTTRSINPSTGAGASPVEFVAATGLNGNRTNHTLTIPNSVQAGDALVLFFAANTTAPTYTGPAGWTEIEATNGSGIVARAYTKVATAADAGAVVRVTSSSYAKADIEVAAYRGTDPSDPVAVSAAGLDNSTGAAHTSPTLTAPAGNNTLLTYWADKSTSTTAWTAPGGQTTRNSKFGTGSGHMSGLITDRDGVSGSTGGLTATANSASTRGVSFSVVLH